MKVGDIMRRDFIWFHGNDSLEHVLSELAKNHVSAAPVFDEGEFLGIVSAKGMVRFFSQKGYAQLWKKDRETPLERMKKANAAVLSKKPRAILSTGQDVEDVLPALSGEDECIPVIDGNRMVGVIRGDDLLKMFLTEVAKGAHRKVAKEESGGAGAEVSGGLVDTTIDKLVEMVRREKSITAKKAAAELGISQKGLEKLAETLQKHHLIRMEYSFLSGAVLKIIEHDKK